MEETDCLGGRDFVLFFVFTLVVKYKKYERRGVLCGRDGWFGEVLLLYCFLCLH